MEEIICLNCGEHFVGKYCPHCGQSDSVRRLTFKSIIDNFTVILAGEGAVVNNKIETLRYGLFGTIGQLYRRPVTVIREYIEGKRRKYYNPIGLLFLLSGIYALQFALMPTQELPVEISGKAESLAETFRTYIMSHIGVMYVLMTPFIVFFYRRFFRKVSDFNYTEYFYAEIFIINMYLLPSLIYFMLNSKHIYEFGIISAILSILYYVVEIVIIRNLVGMSWTRAILGCIAANILGYLCIMIVILMIMFIVFFTAGALGLTI